MLSAIITYIQREMQRVKAMERGTKIRDQERLRVVRGTGFSVKRK